MKYFNFSSCFLSSGFNLGFCCVVAFLGNLEPMDANLLHHNHQQQQLNCGLMRYRSAPTSLLTNFVGEDEGCNRFISPPSSSSEAESMFARFMSCGGGGDSGSPDLGVGEIRDKSFATAPTATNSRSPEFIGKMEQEPEVVQQHNGYPPASQMTYKTAPPPTQSHSSSTTATTMESSFSHPPQMRMSTGNCSNLIRHSSSPAGILSQLTVKTGYAVTRGTGNFRAGNGINGEAAVSTSRLKGQMNFLSGPPSPLGLMSQMNEIESENIGTSSTDNRSFRKGNGGNGYIPGFPIGSWDDSTLENFTCLKRVRDTSGKMISGLHPSETQTGEAGNHTPGLTHHLSLPKTSAEMNAMEKFLQCQDSVPCKIRAKRGCATHPRSIAERVRRTRISERMRKLQEFVPNMDKQTNTADMLDLAVDYIKDLQKQVKTLSDNQVNCTCSS